MTAQPAWLQAKNIQKLFKILAQNGGEGRIVGGAVRDHLLGVPIGDVDFCSTHTPQELIEIARQGGIRYIETGVNYGTVTLILDNEPFEVTSLREDVETDGRHAKVAYGSSFEADAKRRDFTFNALYMAADGRIFDPLGGGIEDLHAGEIRFIGNATRRIKEDYLRILRYFRFIARYDFNYNDADYAQISDLVEGLSQLSAERLLMEFKGTFQAKHLGNALQLMDKCNIFKQLFDVKISFEGVKYLEKHQVNYADIWLIGIKLCMPNMDARKLATIVKLSNKDRNRFHKLSELADILKLNQRELARHIYLHGKMLVSDNLIYFAALADFDFEQLAHKLEFVQSFNVPEFPIKGQDLFAIGLKAGPEMGKLIRRLETMWLESDFTLSKQQLLTAI